MSRDANGNFTLPAGNPVISGTAIEATWANPTMTDLGNEITNSLSRTGKGSMLAPLKMPDGSASAPSVTFAGEATSGLHREALADLRMSVTAQDVMRWTATGVDVWNFIKEEWLPLSNSAGFPAPVVVTDVETIAELNKMYAVDMTDLVTKTVLIEDESFGDGDWFMVKAQNWPAVDGVHFLISTQTEEWESPYGVTDSDTRSIRVSANGAYTVQKIAGKWSISDGVGESNATLPFSDLVAEIATKVDVTPLVIAEGQDWEGVDYDDPDAVGTNATAKIYPDGSIVGTTDNGVYEKRPNGQLTMSTYIASSGGTDTWYYPVPMVNAGANTSENITGTVVRGASPIAYFVACGLAGVNGVAFTVYNTSGSIPSATSCRLSAIGRWK